MPFPRCMTDLLMPILDGSKDDFGKDVVPPLPLSLDRVMEGGLISLHCRLLDLPIEVLAIILQYIAADRETLASLALVNSICRQWARSSQFASLHLDYSDRSLAMISLLSEEIQERLSNNGLTRKPSLGACIRRVLVSTHPGWINHRHHLALNEEFSQKSREDREALEEEAAKLYYDRYVPAIGSIVESGLPHLELLDWEDRIVVPRSFFNSFAASSIQHLKLFRVGVDEEFEVIPRAGSTNWPLRSLDIEISWSLNNKAGKLSPLLASILQLCAPTLETLHLTDSRYRSDEAISFGSDQPIPQFPRLRTLAVGFFTTLDKSMLQALLQAPLSTLIIETERNENTSEFFEQLGYLHSLETFVWDLYRQSQTHSLRFLQDNPQLTKFRMPLAAPPQFLNTGVIPLLSRSFYQIKSLSLCWDDVSIPESAIEEIAKLKSLEQLHLTAGCQLGWRHDWPIDHDVMRRHLSHLPCLKKLAFSRDSYSSENALLGIELYYEDRFPQHTDFDEDEGYFLDREELEVIWERVHRVRMLTEGMIYAEVIPTLEWLYFGQIPMSIEQEPNFERYVEPLYHERDDCWTFLRNMFGSELGL